METKSGYQSLYPHRDSGPDLRTMTPTTHQTSALLFVCVIWLCGLRDALASPRGLCAGTRCFAVFDQPEDFAGAQRSCGDSGGELLPFSSDHVAKLLKGPSRGSFWVAAAPVAVQLCPSVTAGAGQEGGAEAAVEEASWKDCHGKLDGFMCQYTFEEPCAGLQTGGGVQTTYTTHMHFEVHDSEAFPPGTIAVTVKTGGISPEAKHVCFSGSWMRAPWSCEVMRGGCEHGCNSATHTCTCPAGTTLHRNNISCTAAPCASNPCTGEGRECERTQGGFKCTCRDGFVEEDGACVNVSICERCEHMLCDKTDGVYMCACRKGFRVAPHDPTKCEVICTERDCPALCVEKKCFCPDGYIYDGRNCTFISECDRGQCHHGCEILLGDFRCLCNEGFYLHHDKSTCLPDHEEEEGDDGSGSTPGPPFPPSAGSLPAYVKTGSVLGIAVFMALAAVLLCFLIRQASRRCGRFELSSLKHPDMDIFYVQQATTETYKRLSFDKEGWGDSGSAV